jgi:hypothetical protein
MYISWSYLICLEQDTNPTNELVNLSIQKKQYNAHMYMTISYSSNDRTYT